MTAYNIVYVWGEREREDRNTDGDVKDFTCLQ